MLRQKIRPEIIVKIREKASLSRAVFAKMLDVTENYLYRVEIGMREPGVRLIKRIAKVCGVPLAELLEVSNDPDEAGAEKLCEVARMFLHAVLSARRERSGRLEVEKLNAKLKHELGHAGVVAHLHLQFEEILCDESLSRKEKLSKIKKLAVTTASEGEVTFSEMLMVFRVKRAVLKEWMASATHTYKCRFIEGREVNAFNPSEAALRLRCFDCEYLEKGTCEGYGDEEHPADIIELLERLSENGVYTRAEQAKVLEESYGIKLSEHQISEIVYREKKGQKIPEGAFNLEGTGEMGKNEV